MILYPVACTEDGAAIHIDVWQRGQSVTCFGCGQELVGRLPHDGIKPTAHFAHKADTACSGETALHKAAKLAIVHSHARGVLHFLSWECPRCKRYFHQTDLRSLALREEARPCEGVVSDVLGLDVSGEPRIAIEVVVTHDVEAETLELYRARGLYVFTLRPSWGSVGDIVRGVDRLDVDHLVGVVDPDACEGCQQVLREKAEWEARLRRQAAAAWWNVWNAAWGYVGREASWRLNSRQRASQALLVREQSWWRIWAETWPRIAEQISDSWWIEWRRMWRELGDQHARPYRWARAWRSVWDAIGNLYAVDEAARVRSRAQDRDRANARQSNWWEVWTRMWPNIAQRESGVMAAWRPICRTCRQDLTPDHRCLRHPT